MTEQRRSKAVVNEAALQAKRSVYTLLLYEADATYLKALGKGNRSEGARRVIQEYRERKRREKER